MEMGNGMNLRKEKGYYLTGKVEVTAAHIELLFILIYAD
jgi:hypothetical protein